MTRQKRAGAIPPPSGCPEAVQRRAALIDAVGAVIGGYGITFVDRDLELPGNGHLNLNGYCVWAAALAQVLAAAAERARQPMQIDIRLRRT